MHNHTSSHSSPTAQSLELHIFKRTIASLDPRATPRSSANTYAGLVLKSPDVYCCGNGSGARDGAARGGDVCAERAVAQSADRF